MNKIFLNFIFIIFINNALAENNFFDINFAPSDISKIKKEWEYNSGIFKTTQSKPEVYKNRIVFLDGLKNLKVLSLIDGSEICTNFSKKPDRGQQRGVLIFEKNQNNVFAIFFRHKVLNIINIKNCNKIILKNKIIIDKPVSAKLLLHKKKLIILINGSEPRAYDLNNGSLIWKAQITKKDFDKINKKNLGNKIYWDVWGGGLVDNKFNQIIFSTANPKPSFVSLNRGGDNLFSNSIVAIDIKTGNYKWHFQEISHDLLNLDHAAPPVIYKDYILQATKNGQLIVVNRSDGKSVYDFETIEYMKLRTKNEITKYKQFKDWLIFSRQNFFYDDINNLDKKYSEEALDIIGDSIVGDQKKLVDYKKYIFYGMHGGAEWPGIAVNPDGLIAIPSNNIAWASKLRNSDDFEFKKYFSLIYFELKNLFSSENKKNSIKKIHKYLSKIINYKKPQIEKYQRFVNKDNIPLNKPPWGTLTLIDIKNKKRLWQVPHGDYSFKDKKLINTGAEIFGSPIITGGGVIFLSGTEDKKIRAYNIEDGEEIWSDTLPFVSYGRLSFAKFQGQHYLLVLCTGGNKFKNSKPGDSLVVYKLN